MKGIWILMAGLLVAAPAAAQKKLYRCGDVFQDRPCAGPKPVPAGTDVVAAGPSQATLEQRRAIRCENFGRQVAELLRNEEIEQNPEAVRTYASQRGSLRERMKLDGC